MEGNRFCILTTGRTASSSLMRALSRWDDVIVPNKNDPAAFNELCHRDRLRQNIAIYERLTGGSIGSRDELISAFYEFNAAAPFAGFKTMPNRHPDFPTFVGQSDITFIVLMRRDIASTVASFMAARTQETWDRVGEPHETGWTFTDADVRFVYGNLSYLLDCARSFATVPDAIRLWYEDLCDPDFRNERLDAFFDRPVRLADPKAPVSGADYVTNWPEFERFVRSAIQQLARRSPT